MERVQWVFRARSPEVDRRALVDAVERSCSRLDDSARRIKLTATLEAPPRWAVIPFSKEPVVLVSLDATEAQALETSAAAVGMDALDLAAREVFEVETSEPVPLPVAPTLGEWAPGCELLTLFRRKPGLDDATLIERWHGGHTPLSLEIHPLWGYIRNVVKRRMPSDATPLDGIVEEYFRAPRDLLNPSVFFAGPIRMVPNMIRVALDIQKFIDMKTIETYWVSERWLRLD